jgi:DNA-directed RNA polymerase specialized sigma24 family protein
MTGDQHHGFKRAAELFQEAMGELYPDPAEAQARLAELEAQEVLGAPMIPQNAEQGTGWKPPAHYSIFACDIASFSSRPDLVQRYLRSTLDDTLNRSFAALGAPMDECYEQDRGDGVLIALPPSIDTRTLLSPLIDLLSAEIRRHNAISNEGARIQLRVAVHIGYAAPDGHMLMGTALNHVFRLLDASPFRSALRSADGALGLIVSQQVYDLVRDHADADEYQQIEVEAKEKTTSAWIKVAGQTPRHESTVTTPVSQETARRSPQVTYVTDDSATTTQQGDAAAFEALFRKHFEPLCRFLSVSFGADPLVAKEVAQDAFMAAHKSWSKIRSHPSPETWVSAAARRLLIERMRRSHRHRIDPVDPDSIAIKPAVNELTTAMESVRGGGASVEQLDALGKQLELLQSRLPTLRGVAVTPTGAQTVRDLGVIERQLAQLADVVVVGRLYEKYDRIMTMAKGGLSTTGQADQLATTLDDLAREIEKTRKRLPNEDESDKLAELASHVSDRRAALKQITTSLEVAELVQRFNRLAEELQRSTSPTDLDIYRIRAELQQIHDAAKRLQRRVKTPEEPLQQLIQIVSQLLQRR